MKRRSFILGLLGLPLAGPALASFIKTEPFLLAPKMQIFDVSLVKGPTDPATGIDKPCVFVVADTVVVTLA